MPQSKSSAKATVNTAAISFVVSIFVLALKYYAYLKTGSAAILSDAAESIVNVLASAMALFVMKYVSEPADDDHPYGHGKLEYFSAAFEGGLIFFASIAIFSEIIRTATGSRAPQMIVEGLWVISLASVINLVTSFYLKKQGEKYNSDALKASGTHLFSDVLTTGIVIVGLLVVKMTGLAWIDLLLAGVLAVHLFITGFLLVKDSINNLLDGVDPNSLNTLSEIMNRNRMPGIIDVHNLKVLRSGNFHHIDGHLVVPEFWDINKAHQLAEAFETKVINDYKYDAEFAFHIDPCERAYCAKCDIKGCNVRTKPFLQNETFSVASITKGPQKDML